MAWAALLPFFDPNFAPCVDCCCCVPHASNFRSFRCFYFFIFLDWTQDFRLFGQAMLDCGNHFGMKMYLNIIRGSRVRLLGLRLPLLVPYGPPVTVQSNHRPIRLVVRFYFGHKTLQFNCPVSLPIRAVELLDLVRLDGWLCDACVCARGVLSRHLLSSNGLRPASPL